MLVWVEEEYGYRSWIWDFPGDVQSLIEHYQRGQAPSDFFDPSQGAGEDYPGTMKQVEYNGEKTPRMSDPEFLAYIHTHEADDSYLAIRKGVPIFGGRHYDRAGKVSDFDGNEIGPSGN